MVISSSSLKGFPVMHRSWTPDTFSRQQPCWPMQPCTQRNTTAAMWKWPIGSRRVCCSMRATSRASTSQLHKMSTSLRWTVTRYRLETLTHTHTQPQNWFKSRLSASLAVSAGNTSHFVSLSVVASCHIELSLFSDRIWSVWAAPSCLQTRGRTGSWSSTRRAAQRCCCATTRNTQTHWHRTWGRLTSVPLPSSPHT